MQENDRPVGMSELAVSRRTVFAALGVGIGLGAVGLPTAASAAVTGWSNPSLGTLTSGYKTASRPGHLGWDIANSQGTPIYAVAAGTVRDIRDRREIRPGAGPASAPVADISTARTGGRPRHRPGQ
ncbi:hypothetical protein [Micromonospora inyonensis]|uniref:hypothetical protein n=1 Tax=Micromonospora inyonensis TaxID=47866 RepID=UPI000A7306C9|nr:hypothetical protein [Micromonospora inyonensis]